MRAAKCICGHGRKYHSFKREDWDIFPADKTKGERQTGDGHCFHWDNSKGFCKCEMYSTAAAMDAEKKEQEYNVR